MTNKQKISIVLVIASLIYDAVPVDLIPDIPFIGWLDDILLTSSAAANCLQQFANEGNPVAQTITRVIKWVALALFGVMVVCVILMAGTIAWLK